MNVHMRLKEEVIEFLKIGGRYHGVATQTYMQWLLERALLDEIHYYGWESLRPVGFDRHESASRPERRELLHLSRIARRRERKEHPEVSSDDAPPP